MLKLALWRDTTFRGEFQAILGALRKDSPKTIVDVGANDGFYGSNSYPFIARGWRALLVEPDPRPFQSLKRRFKGNPRVACLNQACADQPGELLLYLGHDASHSTLDSERDSGLHGAQTGEAVKVRVERLADILSIGGFERRFGVLSIDTEGMDLEVLQGLDLKTWHPDVVFTENFEPKESKKAALFAEHGYRLRKRVDTNTLWTRG